MIDVINRADSFEEAGRGLLELAAKWTPDALAKIIGDALELAALEGREAVFADGDGSRSFADADSAGHVFKEQIEYLRQKRVKPTRAWTDAMAGDHDRAFVIAGATDVAMLEEFHAAVIEAARTRDYKAFAGEFDRIVAKYGWSYNGGREWRIRTIFETNIRTSYMAGRLRQMRDPEVVKILPYWEYIHADTRVPLKPRPEHVAWDRLVLAWNDPWWDVHFPPNDWRCSCGVEAVSEDQLKRMGKSGPDKAPEIVRKPYLHEASGQTAMLPEGVGFGWDHMPGDLWERGLVPSRLIDEAGGSLSEGRHVVSIDQPEPIEDLLAKARPFKAVPMAAGLGPEEYVRAFLEPFGADLGRAVLWEDASGTKVPISELFFRDRAGTWKVDKRGRDVYAPMLAEAILDPDEIWIGVIAKDDPIDKTVTEIIVDRRYIRVHAPTGLIAVMQVGRRWWEEITTYPLARDGKPNLNAVLGRRIGKLVYKRK